MSDPDSEPCVDMVSRVPGTASAGVPIPDDLLRRWLLRSRDVERLDTDPPPPPLLGDAERLDARERERDPEREREGRPCSLAGARRAFRWRGSASSRS